MSGHREPTMPTRDAVTVTGVTKRYGGTLALRGVNVHFRRGAVTAVVGANGSGKTTLLRIVSGLLGPTSGAIEGPGGAAVGSLKEAREAGIVLVPQEPTLAGHLTVWQNISLGQATASRGGFLRDRAAREFAATQLTRLLPESVVDRPASTLSKSSRQLVQLAAAMAKSPKVLMLDEPTAVLDEDGVLALHALIRRFVSSGGTVVLVSHRVGDVLELADDVVVLRNGLVSHSGSVTQDTEHSIVRLLSSDGQINAAKRLADLGEVVLEARNIRGWRGLAVDHIAVRAGEIVGIAGQSGSGRSRLASVLAGAHDADGSVAVAGRPLRLGNMRSAQAAGVAYIPEDRQVTAILGNQPVWANLLVGRDDRHLRRGPFRRRMAERAECAVLMERFEVRPADPDREAAQLSGGNQQKLVVARALCQLAKVVVADEPTQGVDATARTTIHLALTEAAGKGSAVIAVCSEFDELFAICDRVVVLRDGHVVLDRAIEQVTRDEVLAASLGSPHRAPDVGSPALEEQLS